MTDEIKRRRRGLLTRSAVAKYCAEGVRNFVTAVIAALVAGIVFKLFSPPPAGTARSPVAAGLPETLGVPVSVLIMFASGAIFLFFAGFLAAGVSAVQADAATKDEAEMKAAVKTEWATFLTLLFTFGWFLYVTWLLISRLSR